MNELWVDFMMSCRMLYMWTQGVCSCWI